MKDEPFPVELEALWRRLGIERQGQSVRFTDDAPDAAIRRAMTMPRA
jgi:hypothetical protein